MAESRVTVGELLSTAHSNSRRPHICCKSRRPFTPYIFYFRFRASPDPKVALKLPPSPPSPRFTNAHALMAAQFLLFLGFRSRFEAAADMAMSMFQLEWATSMTMQWVVERKPKWQEVLTVAMMRVAFHQGG